MRESEGRRQSGLKKDETAVDEEFTILECYRTRVARGEDGGGVHIGRKTDKAEDRR